jgi:hypothetical protein
MAAPVHLLSMAAEFERVLAELHPERAWTVEIRGSRLSAVSPTVQPDQRSGEA